MRQKDSQYSGNILSGKEKVLGIVVSKQTVFWDMKETMTIDFL